MCVFIEDWKMVGEIGFEPTTYWSQTSRANQAALHSEMVLRGEQPALLWLPRCQVDNERYQPPPVHLHGNLVGPDGLEPPTYAV